MVCTSQLRFHNGNCNFQKTYISALRKSPARLEHHTYTILYCVSSIYMKFSCLFLHTVNYTVHKYATYIPLLHLNLYMVCSHHAQISSTWSIGTDILLVSKEMKKTWYPITYGKPSPQPGILAIANKRQKWNRSHLKYFHIKRRISQYLTQTVQK